MPHEHKYTNRLIHETSPYLLQHAHNPVDWYPWGPEAFEAARRENKPIFLSVGYSTCYWCHVMERESFENEAVADEMNQRFVCIKVDREERPDVDQLYMLAVQLLTRSGGWPMSVFMTPDLRPFYGGTYYPPADAYGRPGFLTVIRAIDDAYHNRLADVEKTCAQLTSLLEQLSEPPAPESPITLDMHFVDELVDRSTADYDARLGGFGSAPKFPRQTLLEMLLVYLRDTPAGGRKDRIAGMLRRTLDAMARGGIRDQLGGGFHRYSTDAHWLVPHFEIMLYDNAMLAWVYAEMHRQFGEARDAQTARGICDFVLREMTSPDGAFYTAFDAEVDAREGKSYLWTAHEVEQILGPEDAKLFNHVYGLDRGPNFADPHHGTGAADANILYLPQALEELVEGTNQTVEQLDEKLAPMRRKLYEARLQRKQPLLDTKVITSWNALMIRALAYTGKVLGEPRYIEAAGRAADFLLERHTATDGALWRTSRDGKLRHPGFLDDYAFLAQALLALHDATGHAQRRQQAAAVATQLVNRFGDPDCGAFYFSPAGQRDLIVRQKVASDSPLPSGNAVAAMVLQTLDQSDLSRDALSAFARQLEESAPSMSAMVEAAMLYIREYDAIAITPGPWRGSADRPESPEQIASGVVSVEAAWTAPDELHLHLGILDTFHINAHQAAEGMIPTSLTVAAGVAGDVEAIDYPPGEERQFSFQEAPIHVYDRTATVVIRFKRPVTGRPPIAMALSFQPCTDIACFPAVMKQFEVNVP